MGNVVTLIAQFETVEYPAVIEDNELEFTLKAGETAVFEGLPAGTSYTLWEETESGWTLVRSVSADGEILANETTDAWFHNRYQTGTVSASFTAVKTLDGAAPAAGAFSFELVNSAGVVVQTVSNSASGAVSFAAVSFDGEGSYNYTIREKAGTDETINYDGTEYTATVEVADDGSGNLSAAVSYKKGSDTVTRPSFANTTKPGSLKVSKDANGNTTKEFSFILSLSDSRNQPYTGASASGLSPVDGTPGSYHFTLRGGESLTINELPAGLRYSLRETDLPGGWSQTGSEGASGVITATVTSEATFRNTYTPGGVSSVSVQLLAHKRLVGMALSKNQFDFILEEKNGESWTE